MAIRSWSFTRLWVINAIIWVVAWMFLISRTSNIGMILAFVPLFIAGAWAGQHDEIRNWPRIRVASLWGAAIGAGVLFDLGLMVVAFAAPVAVLSVRWIELRGARPIFRFANEPEPVEELLKPDETAPFAS